MRKNAILDGYSTEGYKWDGWVGLDWISPGGVKYRAAYAANIFLKDLPTCCFKLVDGKLDF